MSIHLYPRAKQLLECFVPDANAVLDRLIGALQQVIVHLTVKRREGNGSYSKGADAPNGWNREPIG